MTKMDDTNTANNEAPKENTFELNDDLMDQWKKADLIRGAAPENVEKRCLDLCQTFIGGSWALATMDDVQIKRISGGLTNQLWHVKLNDDFPRVANEIYDEEPSEVAIKLFQAKHMKSNHDDDHERLNDIIILTVLAEVGLGPKIYGIFDDGFIQAYHKHEQFRAKHQEDPKLLDECVGLLAKLHHLKLPIRKDKNTQNQLYESFGKSIDEAYATSTVEDICKEANYTNLLERNLKVEWESLKRIIDKLNSPMVLCHCDYRGGNILVTDNGILCIDMEYSNYGPRSFDISTMLNEWGQNEMFDTTVGTIPSEKIIKNFLQIYIDHCERLKPGYASKPENQIDVLYRETRVFFLVIYMFFMSFMVKSEESIVPDIPFDRKQLLGYLEKVYGFYITIKQDLVDEGLIDKEDL